MNIFDELKKERPNTRWFLIMVTNIRFVVNKIIAHPLGCPDVTIPRYLQQKKTVFSLVKDHQGKRISDHLCFFRCYAKNKKVKDLERCTTTYFNQWKKHKGLKGNFCGIHLDDVSDLEFFFKVNITVFSLDECDVAESVYASSSHHSQTMYLNVYQNHLSLITRLEGFCRKFICNECSTIFNRADRYLRHTR